MKQFQGYKQSDLSNPHGKVNDNSFKALIQVKLNKYLGYIAQNHQQPLIHNGIFVSMYYVTFAVVGVYGVNLSSLEEYNYHEQYIKPKDM